jgi:hypothetical protein
MEISSTSTVPNILSYIFREIHTRLNRSIRVNLIDISRSSRSIERQTNYIFILTIKTKYKLKELFLLYAYYLNKLVSSHRCIYR